MQTLSKLTIAALSLVMLPTTITPTNSFALGGEKVVADSNKHQFREVMCSQALFTVKYSPDKKKFTDGKKHIKFRAELRGTFRVFNIDKDTTYALSDWIRCPNDACRVMGTYKYGSADYKKLDAMIAISKKNSLAEQKEFAKMMAAKK